MRLSEIQSVVSEIYQHTTEGTFVWENYTNILGEDENATGIKICQVFAKLNKKHIRNARIQNALGNFLKAKAINPTAPFGGKDYPMIGKGPLGGIKHAGLTNDVSVMYEIKNNTIYLFAIGSHDDLGFGKPNNIKKQKQLVKKIDHCKKSEGI
jgi:mRNA-degrading endonuclease YafQ of YafQ-DinJ toxin-antitoxin module